MKNTEIDLIVSEVVIDAIEAPILYKRVLDLGS